MTLTPCRDCGHEISRNAPACPRCGAPGPGTTEPPRTETVSAGTIARGTFGGICGCIVAPFALLFMVMALVLLGTCSGVQ